MKVKVNDLSKLKTSELLVLYSEIIEELRRRKAVRSNNNPVADYAENLAVKALSLKRAPLSTKGFDAKDKEGHKL
ncbi:hypothetical protein [Candidatus Desulforudis audaxviator]|nr:hypothetical protein [Candidatus Desulforudis audaxviator]AZK59093.1 hypothetical protein Daudx_0538 [Candidatus Desulforudis audaxviator]